MTSRFWVRSLAAVTVGASIYAVSALHRNSYCFSEWRFVPDEESLLVGVMTKMLGVTHDYPMRKPENIAAAKQVLKEKPECCRLLSGAEEDKFLSENYDLIDRFFGYASRIVLVQNLEPNVTNDGARQSIWIVPITSCGLRQTYTTSFTINVSQ
jgi:hypothetical protein